MGLLGLLVAAMLGLVLVTPAQATEYTVERWRHGNVGHHGRQLVGWHATP
jgi:hypothetical protein